MLSRFLPFLTFLLFVNTAFTQSSSKATAYIFKGGLSVGSQKWDNTFDRQMLFRYHGAIAIESADEDSDKYALFAQAGYHIRGSATRFRFLFQGGGISTFNQNFEFRNVALILGAKQKKPINTGLRYYYFAGLRGEYNINTNLEEVASTLSNPQYRINYPSDFYVNKWVGGVSAGGGFEFDFAELIGGVLEVSIHPDFTYQYNQPPINNIIDPINVGQTRNIPQRQIRNVTLEISLGIKLVRKVIYDL